jgi:serine protease Do
MTDELREQLALPSGSEGLVVRDVVADSEAFAKGLRAGDVITEAGQQAVSTPADLEDRIEAAREAGRRSLLLLVRRNGEPRFVALSLEQG